MQQQGISWDTQSHQTWWGFLKQDIHRGLPQVDLSQLDSGVEDGEEGTEGNGVEL